VRHTNDLCAFTFLYLLLQQKLFPVKLLINLHDVTGLARSKVGKKWLKNRTGETESKNYQELYKCVLLLIPQTYSAMI